MKIYILVLVTYDYYRFQDNIAAHTDIDELKKLPREHDDLPVLDYLDGTSDDLDNDEVHHYWIQELEADQ